MAKVHLTVTLDPDIPHERLLLEKYASMEQARIEGSMSRYQISSLTKTCLLGGLFLTEVDMGAAKQLPQYLEDEDKKQRLMDVLGLKVDTAGQKLAEVPVTQTHASVVKPSTVATSQAAPEPSYEPIQSSLDDVAMISVSEQVADESVYDDILNSGMFQ
ncbi:hypothetical protein [Vibrio barjaei]|uniref:hypothetical protein n=1 Tax=Vibrio barjaei TaxID=1676683 RepID=UPI002283B1F6|nr:hypothetical protein [Vibrio barjaei]MCY9872357.1 hypothetical protein [Vibrio barjaei]